MARKLSLGGCLGGCLVIFVLGGLLIWGAGTCVDARYEASQTPAAIAARQQAATDSAIAAQARRGTEEAEARAEAARWAAEQKKQPARATLIKNLIEKGVFRKVEMKNGDAPSACIWVGSGFYVLTYEQKQTFCEIVAIYLRVKHRQDIVFITLRDNTTGHNVGKMGWPGYKLVMK